MSERSWQLAAKAFIAQCNIEARGELTMREFATQIRSTASVVCVNEQRQSVSFEHACRILHWNEKAFGTFKKQLAASWIQAGEDVFLVLRAFRYSEAHIVIEDGAPAVTIIP